MTHVAAGKEGETVVHDWTCRIRCKKHELGGAYWVLIFLGEVPDDPLQWRTCPSFVGGHYVFVSSATNEQPDTVSEGFVHLNKAIASRSGLSSYEPNVVAPYLKDNLEWRVQAVRVSHRSFVSIWRIVLNPSTLPLLFRAIEPQSIYRNSPRWRSQCHRPI